jgi:hypothetical protein
MRILAAAIALSFLAIAALAASPEVEAALKAFQTAGADANRLKTFCELMQVDQQNALKADPLLEAKMDKLLDELGADFKAAWETVDDIDPASDDGKVLNTALGPVFSYWSFTRERIRIKRRTPCTWRKVRIPKSAIE